MDASGTVLPWLGFGDGVCRLVTLTNTSVGVFMMPRLCVLLSEMITGERGKRMLKGR